MWVTKLLISPVTKRIFCPKMTKFGIFVHCRLIWCPVFGLAGGRGARAVSRKTPIYFMSSDLQSDSDLDSIRKSCDVFYTSVALMVWLKFISYNTLA